MSGSQRTVQLHGHGSGVQRRRWLSDSVELLQWNAQVTGSQSLRPGQVPDTSRILWRLLVRRQRLLSTSQDWNSRPSATAPPGVLFPLCYCLDWRGSTMAQPGGTHRKKNGAARSCGSPPKPRLFGRSLGQRTEAPRPRLPSRSQNEAYVCSPCLRRASERRLWQAEHLRSNILEDL